MRQCYFQSHLISKEKSFISKLTFEIIITTLTARKVCQIISLYWQMMLRIFFICSDFFSLSLSYVFDEIIPGSAYSWEVVATSRGLNPLERSYSFSGFSPPTVPVSIITAAGTLDSYDVFTFTVGSQPLVSSVLLCFLSGPRMKFATQDRYWPDRLDSWTGGSRLASGQWQFWSVRSGHYPYFSLFDTGQQPCFVLSFSLVILCFFFKKKTNKRLFKK